MKTYAVIGSNCFTGSHIVNGLLKAGANRVIGISRSPEYKDYYLPYQYNDKEIKPNTDFEFHQMDMVRNFDGIERLLEESRPDVVINVAALSEVVLSHERPLEYFETNTKAVVRLADHLRRCDYLNQYIQVSSGEVFGSCSGPVNEQSGFNPSTPYAISKAAADQYLYTLIENFDFPATIVRSTNVYGRHQQLFKIIPRAIIYLKMGKTIELHGGGLAVKSFIHVRDVVDGLLACLNRKAFGTYHFSVESDQTIADIVRQICVAMGKDFNTATVSVGERLAQDSRYWLDSSKATTELDWHPQTTFEDGVSEVVEWIDTNWDTIINDPLEYIHKS